MDATDSPKSDPAHPVPASDGLPTAADSPLALPILHEVLRALAHGGPVEETLDLLAEKARLLLGCASSALALLEPDRESVSFVAAAGDEAGELKGTRVRLADTVAGQTARTGEPFLAFRPAPSANGLPPRMESAAAVAVYDEGKPIGAFAALNKHDNQPFDGNDFLALSTLAAAASVVLGNARLRSREQRQSRELSILYDAVRRVSGQLSVQEVLQAVVEQAGMHLEQNGIAIFLANDERTHLYIAADEGLSDDDREIALPTNVGIAATLMTATQPLLLSFEDAEDGETPRREGRSGVLRSEQILPERNARSGLVAPIRSGKQGSPEEARGFVLVVSQQPFGEYTQADANLLFALASQAAVAIENAELYEDATRRAEEATALYDLSQAVTSTLNLADVLGRVADSVLSLLEVDKFALFLHDREADILRLVVSRGLPEGAEERLQPRIGEGIPGWVMEFETPTAVQDVAADHRNASAPLHPEGVVSMTGMPLQVGAATIGVLAAMSSRRRLFTVAEMELLYTIANQAAIAIENARVYADMRHQSLELRKYFHRVARALGSSRSPEEVPQFIADLTGEIMNADRCALHTIERGSDGQLFIQSTASAGFLVEPGEAVAEAEFPTDGAPLTPDTPTGWVATRVRPLAVEDLENDERFAGRYPRPTRGEVRSYLGVPLRTGTAVVGVLEVYTRYRRVWGADAARLLLTFASQAAVALGNARLAAERERAERATRLLERLLTMTAQTPPPGPEEVIAALALGLNAPVATLYKDTATGEWMPGPASIPRDAVPLERLVAALNEDGTQDSIAAISGDRSVAVIVLAGADAVALPSTHPILETAAALLARQVPSEWREG